MRNTTEGRRRKKTSRSRGKRKEHHRRKKKAQSGARALQSCDHGSHPSSFLLLILCSVQLLVSFSKGLDVIFVSLCISFDIIYMYESFLLLIGDFILFVMLDFI